MLTITGADIRVHRMKGNDLEQTVKVLDNAAKFTWNEAEAQLGITHTKPATIGRLDLQITQQNCEPNNNLAFDRPVELRLHVDMVPQAVTSLYMYGDWWTRPAFSDGFADVPERTQVALIRTADSFACFVPMVGTEFKAVMGPGGEDWLTLTLEAGRDAQSAVHEPLFICTEADTVYAAIDSAFRFLARERNIRMREERQYPQIFDYLGWCSWNAFYKEVDAQGIRDKAGELREKNVPVRWFLIDDGWMTTKDSMLWDYSPDPAKFDGDFTELIREIKSTTEVKWIGVWRALAGYWAGIHPQGSLARYAKENLLFADNGRVLPSPEKKSAFAFSSEWHRQLRAYGVDFVKVDVQGGVRNHYEGNASMCEGTRNLLEALDASTFWFDGAMINCMGMAMEDILSRPSSAISRNSDDFFPDRPDSFREHLLENAYNALYHSKIYWCDWDMFWTSHPDAAKHALLRAISGGPVYCSDRVNETDAAVLQPLAYEDGLLLRMAGLALPLPQCVFSDPEKSGSLLLGNVTKDGHGAVAAFNLTDTAQVSRFAPVEIPGLAASADCIVYDWFAGKVAGTVSRERSVEFEIAEGGFALHQIVPWDGKVGCLGRTDKYMGIAAVEGAYSVPQGVIYEIHEQGPVGLVSESALERVFLFGEDVTDLLVPLGNQKPGQLHAYTLQLPVKAARAVLSVVPGTMQ